MQNILQIENPSSDEELSKAAIHKAEMSLVELEARFKAVRKLGLENLAAEDGSIIANANKRSMAYTKVSSFPCCKFHWKLLMRYLQRKMRHWGLPHIS